SVDADRSRRADDLGERLDHLGDSVEFERLHLVAPRARTFRAGSLIESVRGSFGSQELPDRSRFPLPREAFELYPLLRVELPRSSGRSGAFLCGLIERSREVGLTSEIEALEDRDHLRIKGTVGSGRITFFSGGIGPGRNALLCSQRRSPNGFVPDVPPWS